MNTSSRTWWQDLKWRPCRSKCSTACAWGFSPPCAWARGCSACKVAGRSIQPRIANLSRDTCRRQKMRHSPRRFSIKLSDGDLRRLHVFCAVTRCGGFAAAESELQMGLPSISRVIKDLEIRLGVRLCQRGRVGFELTEQGRHVYAASLQLTADLKRFEANMSSIHSVMAGTLTLGLIDTLLTDSSLTLP